ncbi:MAG TPA: hypothetical protein VFA71_03995 [Terriglobales bacterium]|nr:hypothetical protein [Terriglobales bacterium]
MGQGTETGIPWAFGAAAAASKIKRREWESTSDTRALAAGDITGAFSSDSIDPFVSAMMSYSRPLPPMSDNEYYVKSTISQYLRHPRTLLPAFPSITAPPETLPRLLNGNAVNLPEFSSARMVKVFRNQTDLIAVVQRVAGTLFQPKVVLGCAESQALETTNRR